MGNRNRTSRRGTDPGAGIRALRLEQLFREELNSVLDGELGDARFDGVRITLVELARDGSRSRIWYAMNDTHDKVRATQLDAAFTRAAPYFRARLGESLPLKRTPELSFRHDPAALLEISDQEVTD